MTEFERKIIAELKEINTAMLLMVKEMQKISARTYNFSEFNPEPLVMKPPDDNALKMDPEGKGLVE